MPVGVYGSRIGGARRAAERKQGFYTCCSCGQRRPVDEYAPSSIARKLFRCHGCVAEVKTRARRHAGIPSREELAAAAESREAARRGAALIRSREMSASRAEDRERRQASPTIRCSKCRQEKGRGDFFPSQTACCKSCTKRRDYERFKRDCRDLSDSYVKRQLQKHVRLRARQIPMVMVEAKRVQLAIGRLVAPKSRASLADRLLRRTERRSPDECWPWTGGTEQGYGYINSNTGVKLRVHRVAYELYVGPIPPSFEVWRICANKLCLNPAHLEVKRAARPRRTSNGD